MKEQGTVAQIYSAKSRSIQCQSAWIDSSSMARHDLSQFVYKHYYQLSVIYPQALIPCLNMKTFRLIPILAFLGF